MSFHQRLAGAAISRGAAVVAKIRQAVQNPRVISNAPNVAGAVGLGAVAFMGARLAHEFLLNRNNGGSSLRYPSDLNDDAYIKFDFFKYSIQATNAGQSELGQTAINVYGLSPMMAFAGSITLPIPNNLKDNTGVLIEEAEIIPSNADNEMINKNPAISTIRNITAAAALTIAKTATGLSINPYTSVLFKHPKFRTHSFTWKLAPQSLSESDTIKEIINTFKAKMLPKRASGGGPLFEYPFLVKPKFSKSVFLYEFKHCFITDIAINYAGGGIPSFYKNHAPTVVDITINLTEIEWQMREEYEQQITN